MVIPLWFSVFDFPQRKPGFVTKQQRKLPHLFPEKKRETRFSSGVVFNRKPSLEFSFALVTAEIIEMTAKKASVFYSVDDARPLDSR